MCVSYLISPKHSNYTFHLSLFVSVKEVNEQFNCKSTIQQQKKTIRKTTTLCQFQMDCNMFLINIFFFSFTMIGWTLDELLRAVFILCLFLWLSCTFWVCMRHESIIAHFLLANVCLQLFFFLVVVWLKTNDHQPIIFLVLFPLHHQTNFFLFLSLSLKFVCAWVTLYQYRLVHFTFTST